MKNNRMIRSVVLLVLLVAVVIGMAYLFNGSLAPKATEYQYTEFIKQVKDGKVDAVYAVQTQLVGRYKDSSIPESAFPDRYDFSASIPSTDQLMEDLKRIAAESQNVSADDITSADLTIDVKIGQPARESLFTQLLPLLISVALMAFLWWLFMRQMQGANKSTMNFGKSRAKLSEDGSTKVTFANVAGEDEEKEELAEVVDFLKSPKKYIALGARIPKGILLVGPPGTGKTLLAKAVAGEAGVPFYSISGSDFVEMYVGVGASRVRDLFEQAKRSAPCIIFIDEIDAVGRHRGAGLGGGHDEREQTLNQLLVEMDGFSTNEGIIIIAATNRPDILDPALLRPGRFDRRVTVYAPDVKGREAVLEVHAKGKPLADDVKLDVLARMTPGFTGADLENCLNEAALLAARRNLSKITMTEIKEAINRVEMGPEKKSLKVTKRDRNLVAYHEAGHAVVAWAVPGNDPVNEVSIIPRGGAGGYTQTLSDEESSFVTRAMLQAHIALAMGGYMAERIKFGDITTGASSDIKNATNLARRMVTEWGMSTDIGPVFLGGEQEVFLGRDYGQSHSYSETLSARIDAEVHALIERGRSQAEEVLTGNWDKLEKLVAALLDREKIDGNEFKILMEGGTLEPVSHPEELRQPEEAKPEETGSAPAGEETQEK